MLTVLLTFIAAAVVALGGREAVRVAQLSAALGARAALFGTFWLACLLASGFAAWAGSVLAAGLTPTGREALVAVAMLASAVGVLVARPGPAPAEPTRSFGAVVLVLGAAQLTVGAGLPVLALAGWSGAPWLAAAGGALGSGAVLSAAWWTGLDWQRYLPLTLLRHVATALLLAAAATAGLAAAGMP